MKIFSSLLAVISSLVFVGLAQAQVTPPTPTYTGVIFSPQGSMPTPAANGKCWSQVDGLHCYYNGGPHGPFVDASSLSLTVGTTPITGGTTTRVLYDNAGVLGEYTNTQLTALINSFSSSLSGAAPASGGGSTNFLRADGTWATPAGTGVTTTGSPASGNLTRFSGANSITNGDLSGDATTSGTLVVTVAKINGATLGTTTATSGNLLIGNGTQWATQAMTGDATITSGGAITLATVNSNVGSFGDGTHVASITVNGKGLITAASSTAITGAPPSGSASGDLSGSYPGPTVAKINGVSLGSTTATAGNLLIGSGTTWVTNAMSGDCTISSAGVLTCTKLNGVTYPSAPSANTVPVVTSATSGGTVTYEAVPNAALANSSMTIAGHSVSLGGTQTIACGDLSNGATGCSTATGTSGATIPLLNGANTWSGVQSFNSGDLGLKGATSGTLTVNAAATASGTLTFPAGTTDFSATGGTSQFVKQASTGAAFTVVRPACADLSNAAASCSTDATNASNISSGTLDIARLPTTLVDSKCVTWDSTLAVTAQTIEYAIPWTSYTVTKMQSAVSGGGSYSVAAKINGTNITSLSAVSVSGTSNTNTSATGANTGSANDQITIVTSSPSGTINQSYVCLVFQHSAN